MKIGDVKVGERYAAHDEKNPGYISADRGNFPREVEVLEIVGVEERTYAGRWTDARETTRTVRKVKVKVIGGTESKASTWSRRPIVDAKPGAVIVIEARNIIGPWSALRGDVKKAIEAREERDRQSAALAARLKALGLKDSSSSVSFVGGKLKPSLSIYHGDVEKLLSLAEDGKAWRAGGRNLALGKAS